VGTPFDEEEGWRAAGRVEGIRGRDIPDNALAAGAANITAMV
jgi:hypothetical protein